MTRLAPLRTQLQQIRRRRALERWTIGSSALLLTVCWLLAAAFVIDWSLVMSRPQRLVMLVIVAGATVWVFRRYSVPWFSTREDEIDLALQVERRHEIDTDLVAALQFESPQAERWGSGRLEAAVVDYVAEYSPTLNVAEGFRYEQFGRRLGALAATVAVLGLLAAIFSGHTAAFFNRFLLGSAHYPTRTQIEQVTVNGRTVVPMENRNSSLKSPFGQPLRFAVVGSGELPEHGLVRFAGLTQGTETEIELTGEGNSEAKASKRTYAGELPRLVDSVSFQLHLGDAWTDPLEIELVPVPVVALELLPIAPEYARRGEQAPRLQPAGFTGARQISVLESSRVDLRLNALNKELKSATLTIGDDQFPLVKADDAGRQWTATPKSPLASVRRPLRFSLQVEDVDGLSLERPVEGAIRLKTDRSPRVAAAMITRLLLPTAQPRISWGATDDYGLSRVRLLVQVDRHDGRAEQFIHELRTVPQGEQPQTTLRGESRLDLSPFRLEKGDAVRLTVEAYDYRGKLEPKSSTSEPLVVEITDRNGILASLLESDQKSAEQLDEIIRRELGIGGTR